MFMGASTKEGMDIATESRDIIRSLIGEDIKNLNPAEKDIVERIVHSTADPEYGKLVSISNDFVDLSLKSLEKQEDILTDINMVKVGITQYDGNVYSYIKDEKVKEYAKTKGITRAAAAIEYAALEGFEGIIAIGNAPTSLLKSIELVESGELNARSIVGVPVGFVKAADSKEALANTDIPHVITHGPKGGTPVAVACVNSLISTLKNENY
ncbi:cobalt-precorrin-8 methylmutase [Methanobrevibacter sp.]